MFPGFFFNLLMFLSPAGGQLWLALSVAATPCQRLASPLGGRWCPVGTVQRLVSAAASVGDGRSPLGCITRAGRREWTRVSEDGEGKLPASPAAPVAIALAGACASGTGVFLAAAH